ncbi:MAG TPA: glycosyltransferase [Verrucomicrobiae bacterium]|nr:glycosyltransferase [Verrucomicrobiae bacterium]
MADALLLVCDFNARGGTQTQVLELLAALDRRAWSPTLCTLHLDDSLSKRIAQLDVPIVNLGLKGWFRGGTLRAIVSVASRIRAENVRVVHAFLHDGNLVGAIASRRAGVPYVTSVRNLDLRRGPLDTALSGWAHRGAAAVTFNSRQVRDLVVSRERLPLDRTRIIANGIGETSETIGPTTGADPWPAEASPRLLCLASLSAKKGHPYLLAAFSRLRRLHPGASLVIAGSGPERGSLEEHARALGLERAVIFAGHREDARGLLARADLLLLASIEEGMPNALLEAMAAGVPQVATSVGAVPETMEDGVTGYLVPPRDPVLLAARAARILADGELRRRMSAASRDRFVRRFGRDRMAREHEALYAAVAGGRR